VLGVLDSSVTPKLPMTLRPLVPDEVSEFKQRISASKDPEAAMKATEKIKRKAKAILDAVSPKALGDAVGDVVKRWVDSLAPLEPVLVRKPPPRGRRR
jgi:hypothetical protein